jgi:hypothetical protein
MIKNYDLKTAKSAIDYAFKILLNKNVAQSHTKWSIVYDVKNLRIYFLTDTNRKIRYIDLESFDFSCSVPVKTLDISATLSGNVTKHFVDYSKDTNQNLLKKINSFYGMPRDILGPMMKFPETTVCNQ